jgi:hypothetical protein
VGHPVYDSTGTVDRHNFLYLTLSIIWSFIVPRRFGSKQRKLPLPGDGSRTNLRNVLLHLKKLNERESKKIKSNYVSELHIVVTALYVVHRTYAIRVLAFMKHSRQIFGRHHKIDETTSFAVFSSKTTSFVNVPFIRRSVTYVRCAFCVNAASPFSHLTLYHTCSLIFGCVPIQIVQSGPRKISPPSVCIWLLY